MIALADFAVTVTNAQVSAQWWQEKLGFDVHTIGAPGSHALMVAPPGERFLLHLCAGFEPVEPGNSGIAFVTDDLDGLVRRMEVAGVVFIEPLKKSSWGGSAKFADPDGNVFWLLGAPTQFIREQARKRARTAAKRRAGSRGRKRSSSARREPPGAARRVRP